MSPIYDDTVLATARSSEVQNDFLTAATCAQPPCLTFRAATTDLDTASLSGNGERGVPRLRPRIHPGVP